MNQHRRFGGIIDHDEEGKEFGAEILGLRQVTLFHETGEPSVADASDQFGERAEGRVEGPGYEGSGADKMPAGGRSFKFRLHKWSVWVSNSGKPVMSPKLGLTKSSSSASVHSRVGKVPCICLSSSLVSFFILVSINLG